MKAFPLFDNSDYLTDALIARVSAGEPIEIGDEMERIDLNWMLTKGNPNCLLIQVQGDSMADEIADGDWVMLDRERRPQPNDIVLAYLDGYTLKRYKLNDSRGKNGLYLVPANDLYDTRKVNKDDGFEIYGVVTHIIKRTV